MPNSDCPVCRTADIVCGKWTLLVIRDLADGRSRFCELERSLEGISPRTLSLRLRALEEESPAGRAGLQRGDLLVGVNGGPLASVDELFDALEGGDDLKLTVLRGTEEREVDVILQ